jgi:hypothetical protein
MTFLNIILLGGLSAAGIPVLIHLLNRNRFKVVKWGAMHLLEAAFQPNQRRLQIEHWLLLLVRCLIPALLALCLARPVITGASQLFGAAKSSLVLLLDNSYSMEFSGGGSANFSEARDDAANILANVGRGSDASLILMAGGVAPLLPAPTFDLDQLQQLLKGVDSGFGTANVPEAMEMGAGTLAKMSNPYRELIVVSDFQRVSWSEAEGPARARLGALMKKQDPPPRLTFIHAGADARDNVAVEALDFSRLVFGVGQQMQLRATIRNFGDRPYPELRVQFLVDGREQTVSQINLSAHEQQQVLFSHAFATGGSHVVEVRADADALKADNYLQASIPVWDRVPVLLINGDPSPEPLKGETDFLEIALQPFARAKAELSDLITSRVILPAQLTQDHLGQARVVVLANVERLTEQQAHWVNEFVRDGGGLLIFLGDRVNVDWYNRSLAPSGLMPLSIASLAGSAEAAAPSAKIVGEHYSHAALELFNDPRNGSLADAEIKFFYKLKEARAGRDSSVNTLAQLTTGDPFLVEKKHGEGRVIACATACDADWGSLPLRSAYVPLMQRLVTYLASSVFPPRNVEVGRPLAAFLPRGDAGRKAYLTDPSGQKHELNVIAKGSRSVIEFTRTQRPGLYTLNPPDGSAVHFVVSTSRQESDLEQLKEPEQQALAKSMGAAMLQSWKEWKKLDQTRRFGTELWRPLLWMTLALLLGELLLQQSLTRPPKKALRFPSAPPSAEKPKEKAAA